mmetsp:Transcript_111641/g.346410  ORF Transcript_111641/g.346410 Transcript_111641/m.346410 type:complete len:233 (-) Transcript_111641:638-1336(-)
MMHGGQGSGRRLAEVVETQTLHSRHLAAKEGRRRRTAPQRRTRTRCGTCPTRRGLLRAAWTSGRWVTSAHMNGVLPAAKQLTWVPRLPQKTPCGLSKSSSARRSAPVPVQRPRAAELPPQLGSRALRCCSRRPRPARGAVPLLRRSPRGVAAEGARVVAARSSVAEAEATVVSVPIAATGVTEAIEPNVEIELSAENAGREVSGLRRSALSALTVQMTLDVSPWRRLARMSR